MSVSFCLPHPVAVSAFMICRGLCACTEMLWMCVGLSCSVSFFRRVCTCDKEGCRSIVLWNRRVLPWFQYGDNLGLSLYGQDLILHEA